MASEELKPADVLLEAAETFRFYEREHRTKAGNLAMQHGAHSPEYFAGQEKVIRNQAMAEKCEDALAALATPQPAEARGMVEAIHMLRDAAATFRDYERLHQAKVDQGRSDHGHAPAGLVAKVERNKRMAERCEAAADAALSALRANGAERECGS